METKLTLQDCMKYPKAKIQETFGDELVIYNNILDRLTESDYPYWEDLLNCKLILRDISQLTEEEKEYIKKYFGNRMVGMKVFDWKEVCGDFGLSYLIGFIQTRYIVELINYLRSINVDIDGMLESGKAAKEQKTVDEEEINSEKFRRNNDIANPDNF